MIFLLSQLRRSCRRLRLPIGNANMPKPDKFQLTMRAGAQYYSHICMQSPNEWFICLSASGVKSRDDECGR